MLETQLRGGMSVADLEKALKSPQPQQPHTRCSAVSVNCMARIAQAMY